MPTVSHPYENTSPPLFVSGGRSRGLVLAVLSLAVVSCASSDPGLPSPRPLVVYSGARLTADPDVMEDVDDWIRDQVTEIQQDPSFLVQTVLVNEESYPWEGLIITGDTVKYSIERSGADANTPYQIYAHLRLMREMGRLDEWIEGVEDLDEYGIERAIVDRTARSWLYGRAILDAAPYRPLDELIYARDRGWLDAYVLHAQADRFPDRLALWREENPGAQEDYVAWFRETFDMDPPGLRGEQGSAAPTEAPDSSGVS